MRIWHLFTFFTLALVSFLLFDIRVAHLMATIPSSIVKGASIATLLLTPFANLIFWSILSLILWIREYSREPLYRLFQITCVCGFVMFVCGLLKITFGRARPELLLNEEIFGFFNFQLSHSFRSFPSSHASIGFALATLVGIFSKNRTYWIYWVVGAISLTRIITNHHYISDVIVGGLIGHFVARAVFNVTERYNHVIWKLLKGIHEKIIQRI